MKYSFPEECLFDDFTGFVHMFLHGSETIHMLNIILSITSEVEKRAEAVRFDCKN